jgi:signal transduction histidine kinase
MHSQHATPQTIAHPETATPVLRGRSLALARAGWAALVALNLGLFAAAVPALYAQRDAPPEAARAGLAQLGISEGLYAVYFTALLVGFGLGCFAVAAMIAWHRSTDPMALFVSVFLVLMGTVNAPNVQALAAAYPAWGPLLKFSWWTLWAALILFVFLFPDGRFAPRWTRVPVVLLIVGVFIALFFGEGSLTEPPDALGLVLIGGLLAGAAAQIYRYRSVSSPEGRQQTKWVVFAMAAAIVIQVMGILAEPLFVRAGLPGLIWEVADTTIITFAFFLIPLSIGVAILRYRLWDIDLIVNRALVYGALTAGVVGLYVLVVGGLGVLLQARGNLLVSLLAVGLVAVLFAPLKDRLQRAANRLMYGERDDPYGVLSRLGQRLETTLAPEAVLPAIVENVARALRLPHVAIWLADGDALHLGAAHGEAPPETAAWDAGAVEKLRHAPDGLRPADLGPSSAYGAVLAQSGAALVLPLTHRGELVGALCVAPRGPGEGFFPADRLLLRDLATQSGAAVHAVHLTVELRSRLEDLRRSRERLVAAQEEERRRIQRNLHDGLGPVLASMRLRLEACLDAAQDVNDPMAGDLERLYELVGQATGDIRRLVYDLRPPVLDQLGLVPALQQHCERFSRETGIEVGLESEENLPVPAAAEVALLRIVQEALLNVEKHARAARADVQLGRHNGWLALEIRDDGVGFEANGCDDREGTGIGSMRERAELLGGTLRIVGHPGTKVEVRIPVQEVVV